ncbi:MAG: hypothetical protein QF631_09200 [Arenicellales bacterium]|jgi:hypothetical protein|nr:hypothetical protein [Arenicellales bacterium]|tara:strand:- start:150 stop:701 length:552 start_codon:yes stop_codon:yes gene_type:complete
MNTKIPFILLFAASISYTSAYGCDISHFPFGASLEGVTQQLQLDLSAAERARERRILRLTGDQLCPSNPKFRSVEVNLTFLYNKLVQIQMILPAGGFLLRDWAEDRFGALDRPVGGYSTNPGNVQLFRRSTDYLFFYSTHFQGGRRIEMVQLTSLRHKKLYDRYYREVEAVEEIRSGASGDSQ